MIRIAVKKDLEQIAGIHKEQFATHFLGKYSKSIIMAFYECFLSKSYFIVYEKKGGEVVGFVMGGYSNMLSSAKNEFLQKHRFRSIWETILRPNTWRMAAARLAMLRLNNHDKTAVLRQSTNDGSYRLLSIAVQKNFMGKGIAGELMSEFESTARKYEQQYGLSVNKYNDRAIRFYKKNGFYCEKEESESLYFLKKL